MTETAAEPAADRIGRALGRIPSGCAILTARTPTAATGMLASWVQQASFDPPAVTVAVKKGRPIARLIDESGAFVLNLLGEDPGAMFKHFGKGFAPGEEAFAGLRTREVAEGVVLGDPIAWLSARVLARHAVGDHWLYVGALTDAGPEEPPEPGLKPPYVHVRKNGLSY